MPDCRQVGDVASREGKSIRSARKDAGRKSRLDFRRLQLKATRAVDRDGREEEEAPPIEVTGGVVRTGRSARYSPSPQPSGLRYPQAGIAGARPSGKVGTSKGNRY